MNLLNPAALWWLLLVPALVALYMLRPQVRRQAVPSLRLWKELPQVERPTPRLRRPPLSLLLLLQALLLLIGAFALMQPALQSPAARNVTLLLDTSGSMQLQDGSTTRFEEARSQAVGAASGLPSTDRVTLIGVGPVVSTLCQACSQADFKRALGSIAPGYGTADWPTAMAIAEGLASQKGGDSAATYVISDGAFDTVSGSVPAGTHFIGVGGAANNQAITVLSAARPPSGLNAYSAYARVDNVSSSAVSLQVTALADTVPLPARTLNIPAGGHSDVTWQLPAGTLKLTVTVQGQDALQADNQAVLFLPADAPSAVLVHSNQPNLYMRALSGYNNLQPITDTAGSTGSPAFTVWEGALPASLPAGGLLLVNPSGSLFSSSGDLTAISSPDIVQNHPLVADLDLRALYVSSARKLTAPSWLQSVVESPQGPLLLVGEQNGRRVAVLTFNPSDSNLPTLAAFPLLMANAADWLYPQGDQGALHPGDAAVLPPNSLVATPGGKQARVGEAGVFLDTNEPGVYTVSTASTANNGAGTSRAFSVNMTNQIEATAQPRSHPELEKAGTTGPVRVTIQDFWWPVSAFVLALAGGEWLLYCLKRGRI